MKSLAKVFLSSALFFSLGSTSVDAQSNVKAVPVDYKFKKYESLPTMNSRLTLPIHADLFLVYHQPTSKGGGVFSAYNAQLKELYRIPVESQEQAAVIKVLRPQLYPVIAYNQRENKILIVESDYGKGGFNYRAKTYTTEGKLVQQEKFFIEGHLDSKPELTVTEDGSSFAIFQQSAKPKQKKVVTVYNFALQKQYSRTIAAKEKETFVATAYNNSGNAMLASMMTAANQLWFYKLDAQGNVVQSLSAKMNITGKQYYEDFLVQVQDDRLVLAAEKNFKEDLVAIDMFDVNFAAGKVAAFQSTEFTAANVKKLYDQVNEAHIINKNYKFVGNKDKFEKPEHLSGISMVQLLLDKDNIYLVSESRSGLATTVTRQTYSSTAGPRSVSTGMPTGGMVSTTKPGKTVYFANDILVTAFSGNQNSWNTVIGRRMYCGEPALGGWQSLEVSVKQNENNLVFLTTEFKRGDMNDVTTYLRKVEKQTGVVTAPTRITGGKFWTNGAFTAWVAPDQLLLFRTEKVLSIGKYFLTLITVDEQQN